jgi:hypothetical protein
VDGLAAYLAKLPANTPGTPATVGIKEVNISVEWGKIRSTVEDASRYVILDLSSCIANDNTIERISGNDFIKGLILPKSITSIEPMAFARCESLTAISVHSGNPAYSSQDGVLFNKTKTALIQYPLGKSGAYTIPEGVTTIGDWAFAWCESLAGVTIPAGVTSIRNNAFMNAFALTSVTFAAGSAITAFGDLAFPLENGGAGTYVRSGRSYYAWDKQ